MNYGRKSTAKKEKELLSKGTMIRKKFTVIFAKTLLVCLIAFTVVGGCAGYGVYKGIVDSAPNIILTLLRPDIFPPYWITREMRQQLWSHPVPTVSM